MELILQTTEPTDGTIAAGTVVFYPGTDGILRSKSETDVVVTYAESNGIAQIVNNELSNLNLTSSMITDFSQSVRNTILTGLSIVLNTTNLQPVTATDSILQAITKLQARNDVMNFADFARNTTGLINNTTTEEDFLVLNTNIPVDGEYEVHWSFDWSGNDGAQDIIVRLYSGITVRWTNQQEPKDTAGTGVNLPNTTGGTSDSGSDQRHLGHVHEIFVLPAGPHQLKITLDSSGAGDLNAIYKGVISIKKFGVN